MWEAGTTAVLALVSVSAPIPMWAVSASLNIYGSHVGRLSCKRPSDCFPINGLLQSWRSSLQTIIAERAVTWGFFWKRQVVLGRGRKSIGWQGDLVVHPNLNFHLSCSKRGTSVNCCSDAASTSWWVWSDALFAVLLTASSIAEGGILNCKTPEGHL